MAKSRANACSLEPEGGDGWTSEVGTIPSPMNILVLGGTQFSGRAFVEQAADAGHAVTILHRSETDELPPPIRRLRGDRDPRKGGGLDEIKKLLDAGERFDAVVDMCGYTPRVVRASCELLAEHADQYLFVSTISVYPRSAQARPSEGWDIERLVKLDDPAVEVVTGETYGGLKVLCERAVREALGDRATIVRPGVIAGPHDPTDRVTWWTRALTQLDAIVLPEGDAGLAQFIDARDLAAFFLRCLDEKLVGSSTPRARSRASRSIRSWSGPTPRWAGRPSRSPPRPRGSSATTSRRGRTSRPGWARTRNRCIVWTTPKH